jgi:hypothetical protein
MSGRKPKDLDLKLLGGNPGKRPAPTSSSYPTAPFAKAPLEKPDDIEDDEYASQEWDLLVDTLAPIFCRSSRRRRPAWF